MFKKILLITLIIMVATIAITAASNNKGGKHHNRRFHEDHYKDKFIKWMGRKKLLYSSEHFQNRYENFKDNVDFIENWNDQDSDTILGLNDFSDLSNIEYKQLYLGAYVDASGYDQESALLKNSFSASIADEVPSHLDWRVKGAVSHVKNQGHCGSCYTFSTTGALEGANFIATGEMTTLSEQQLVDCTRTYGNEGCEGGLMVPSFQYIIDNGGINSEESYPYIGKDKQECKFDPSNIAANMSGIVKVKRGSEESLLEAIQKSPVAIAIDAGQRSFQHYQSGVYYDSKCSRVHLSHAVLLVGYGTDETSVNPNYWIVKNSWGEAWGQQGYVYMARDRNNHCGISSMASYPLL
ncbi:hypothetical protein CYY_005681 [Polysphondylium violaceum]|uniref:Uncharacterized protein n=1 Tax=Polysphondylium violaceum TaxID=133409 RepID=A0A8J4UZG6_9MYCE|nr:hypothetical protein CYY_005681 [Polysphondylium violaceum]